VRVGETIAPGTANSLLISPATPRSNSGATTHPRCDRKWRNREIAPRYLPERFYPPDRGRFGTRWPCYGGCFTQARAESNCEPVFVCNSLLVNGRVSNASGAFVPGLHSFDGWGCGGFGLAVAATRCAGGSGGLRNAKKKRLNRVWRSLSVMGVWLWGLTWRRRKWFSVSLFLILSLFQGDELSRAIELLTDRSPLLDRPIKNKCIFQIYQETRYVR